MIAPRDAAARRWPSEPVPFFGSCVLLVASLVLVFARVAVPADGSVGHPDGPFDRLGLRVSASGGPQGVLRDDMVIESVDGVSVDDLLGNPAWAGLPGGSSGSVHTYRVLEHSRVRDVQVELHEFRLEDTLAGPQGLLAFGLASVGLAAMVLRRRSSDPAAGALLVFATSLTAIGVCAVFGAGPGDLAFAPWLWALWRVLNVAGFCGALWALCVFAMLFPRPPAWIAARPRLPAVTYLIVAAVAVSDGPVLALGFGGLEYLRAEYDLGPLPFIPLLVLALWTCAGNIRRARRDLAARRDLRVVGIGLGIAVGGLVGLNLIPTSVLTVADPVFLIPLGALPLSVAYAVLRRGSFDFPVVVNRTIVYTLLTVALIGAYTVGVMVLQHALRISALSASIPFTAVLAVAFAPARIRVQRLVDRRLYGRRDDPYAVLAEVSRGLAASGAPVEALGRLAEAIRVALRFPRVAVRVSGDAEAAGEIVAQIGFAEGDPVVIPLLHRGRHLGVLEVWPRSPGEALGESDLRLLDDLAAQAAVTADALRLGQALARSRARALTASADERDRIRRDLHDGLGPTLTGISLQLSAALDHLPAAAPAAEFVARAAADTALAKTEVRRLIEGMAPVELEQFGLMMALRSLADRFNADPRSGLSPGHLVVEIDGPGEIPAVSPAVEVGAYRIVAEALLNAARHSGGRRCGVRVGIETAVLVVEIRDDGTGVVAPRAGGVGLASMQARANALGGRFELSTRQDGPGTWVRAELPLDAEPDDVGGPR